MHWKISRFAVVSGLGWSIDMAVFSALTWTGIAPFVANMASAALAVTFVFGAATWKVFETYGRVAPRLSTYWLYQAVALPAASAGVAGLATLGLHPVAAKVLITPTTFYANFVFMAVLNERRLRWY